MSQGKIQKHHPGGPGHREGVSAETLCAMMTARIAELEAALRSYPREPIGLLKDDAEFRARVLAWHERFAEWQFDLPILPKPE